MRRPSACCWRAERRRCPRCSMTRPRPSRQRCAAPRARRAWRRFWKSARPPGFRPAMNDFSTVLIANRGEIAVRVMRTARALGYRTVAVYSDIDRDAPHVRLADRAVPIGPAPAGESYLSIDRIIAAAGRSGADAIHPGYGFLSESAAVARACTEAGILFLGPPAQGDRVMGNKAQAKRRMKEAGVPCVPGYDGAAQDDATLAREALAVGLPVMIKAAAGGGGKGMRLVTDAARLPDALRAARAEAENAFGLGE